jgi:hypothetical protein
MADHNIEVDYSLPLAEVYIHATRETIRQDKSLDVITNPIRIG